MGRTYRVFAPHTMRQAAFGVAALVLAGCSSSSSNTNLDPVTTGSIKQGSLRETVNARKAWETDRKNLRKGMAYVRHLQALGQHQTQLQVLEQLIRQHPTNTKLLVYYGKRLIAYGQSGEAVKILKRAEARGENDWRLYSALGSALDQTGRHAEARDYYNKALAKRPGEIKIHNNMAMSYMLEGKFSRAESILRKASQTNEGRAEPRIRQNLALVVGLQGRFNEARQIASRDLPPEQVEANMAYLKRMLGGSNKWNKLKKS